MLGLTPDDSLSFLLPLSNETKLNRIFEFSFFPVLWTLDVFREVSDLPEEAQQERGRAESRLCPPDSVGMEDEAWSRTPLPTKVLQLTPSGPALSQAADPRPPCYLLGETH